MVLKLFLALFDPFIDEVKKCDCSGYPTLPLPTPQLPTCYPPAFVMLAVSRYGDTPLKWSYQ